jgi:UPF0755 protein
MDAMPEADKALVPPTPRVNAAPAGDIVPRWVSRSATTADRTPAARDLDEANSHRSNGYRSKIPPAADRRIVAPPVAHKDGSGAAAQTAGAAQRDGNRRDEAPPTERESGIRIGDPGVGSPRLSSSRTLPNPRPREGFNDFQARGSEAGHTPYFEYSALGPTASPMDYKSISPRSPRAALEPERVPVPPPRRSARARHPLVIVGNAIFTLLILLAIVIGGALVYGKQRFEARGPLAEDKVVNIPARSGVRDIADLLVREGVIDSPWTFIGGVIVLKAREDLKFGEYQFAKQSSLQEVISTIIDGKVVQHQMTVPEGLTSEQIVQRLLDNDILTGNVRELPREGSLLPETYKFTRGTAREVVIQRMQQAQRRIVQEIWDHRMADLPVRTAEQLVTLASIVEKETGRPDERTRVAAVFVNRLKQKIKLQSDPTIVYGLVGGKGSLGRPIQRREIDQPTPYNTYVIDGLPPGPIANPGRASLEAAANPARTKEIFFVADGTGGHTFSETLDQHNKAVGRLRVIEAQQRGDATSGTDAAPAGSPAAPSANAVPAAAPTTPARRPAAAAKPPATR